MSLDAATFSFVRDVVRQDAAIVLEDDKAYLVESRLLPLARQAGADDIATYVRGLRTRMSPQARNDIVEAMTTNETSFFRDREPFNALTQRVFPDLASSGKARINVWSAACSSGQEAYSIAIAAKQVPALHAVPLSIVGTDISTGMVNRAKAGLYTQLEINRGLPVQHLVKYFTRDGSGWRVNDDIKRHTSFSVQNLMSPVTPPGSYDVVFLRNVLIYLDRATKQSILRRVRAAMNPEGYLFLGAAETTLGLDESWERMTFGRSSFYRPRKDRTG